MDVLDPVFLEALRHILRDRTNVPVGPAGGDDHVVGVCGFAAKVDGDRLFRLHVIEAREDQAQRLVGIRFGSVQFGSVRLRLQGRGFRRCFTRSLWNLG
ncbi:hypothetical protein chiPu_0033557 [Chiloscyllium punctatum]|uniref:Uncharacterized protein n=1 Tax=Chiloscyllium punctatum TaxID=137246 RepID=A0A401U361_CHIPU|nr:hypothetical protein [Chiloscyllium punctatum]